MKRFIICLLSAFISSIGLVLAQEPDVAVATNEPDVAGAAQESGADASVVSASVGAVVGAADATRPVRDNNTLWDEANTAYIDGDFASAVALYDSIEHSGMVSAKLYYNKAGALFKMGKTGETILYYNKAQRLAPADADIAHNLEIASSYTRNRIEPVPEFFLKNWMRRLSSIMSGNAWAWLSLALFGSVLAGGLLYLLPIGRRVRKAGFYGGLAAIVLFAFAFSFARSDYRETVRPTGGIVSSPSAAVKSSPDNAGKDLFLLYEGDKVKVLDAMNDWSEIVVANGNRGWMRSAAISMID
jgi:tetratricopeptide (TPR) repeat protein